MRIIPALHPGKELALSATPVITTPIAYAPGSPAAIEPKSSTPRLSIVIVNYRQWEQTEELVRHLQATPALKRGDAEIVIVDNHSPAHPIAKRLRRLPN